MITRAPNRPHAAPQLTNTRALLFLLARSSSSSDHLKIKCTQHSNQRAPSAQPAGVKKARRAASSAGTASASSTAARAATHADAEK